jgi:hypothetical protein
MYPDSEILFPARCIPELRNVRPGTAWHTLIDQISRQTESHEDVLTFSLMMIRMNNCLTCDLDSYRASLGCGQCARRTIQGFKGSDKELMGKLEEARSELHGYFNGSLHAQAPHTASSNGHSPATKSKSRGKR